MAGIHSGSNHRPSSTLRTTPGAAKPASGRPGGNGGGGKSDAARTTDTFQKSDENGSFEDMVAQDRDLRQMSLRRNLASGELPDGDTFAVDPGMEKTAQPVENGDVLSSAATQITGALGGDATDQALANSVA
ncbi:MAG: hypothetical protein FJX76_29280, partial [Armatimonadetes bacterium]|nr:hypothetical protein [Armatimonadota bacterium]